MGTRCLLFVGLAATATIALLRGGMDSAPRSARVLGGRRAAENVGKPGRATTEDAPRDVASEQRTDGAAEVAGARVLDDATGEPVAGARIEFYRANWTIQEAEIRATAVTDGTGRFSSPVDFDVYWMVVRAEGYPPTAFNPDREDPDLRLGRGVTRTLSIVDEDGNPGAHAQVDVYGDYALLLRLHTVEADARGIATLWLSGNESVLVRLPGYGYEDWDGTAMVVLRRGYSIGGKVVDSAGRPVGGARVTVCQGGG